MITSTVHPPYSVHVTVAGDRSVRSAVQLARLAYRDAYGEFPGHYVSSGGSYQAGELRQSFVFTVTPELLAGAIGRQHGVNAAGHVIDGNTSRYACAVILQGIEDIDPEVMDAYREPSLSGEYADDYSERDLARDIRIAENDDAMDDAANAYNDAASSAFWAEIERLCRLQLG